MITAQRSTINTDFRTEKKDFFEADTQKPPKRKIAEGADRRTPPAGGCRIRSKEREDHSLDETDTDERTHDTDPDRDKGSQAGVNRVQDRLDSRGSHFKGSDSISYQMRKHSYTPFTGKVIIMCTYDLNENIENTPENKDHEQGSENGNDKKTEGIDQIEPV